MEELIKELNGKVDELIKEIIKLDMKNLNESDLKEMNHILFHCDTLIDKITIMTALHNRKEYNFKNLGYGLN
jgi:hypothetical protein